MLQGHAEGRFCAYIQTCMHVSQCTNLYIYTCMQASCTAASRCCKGMQRADFAHTFKRACTCHSALIYTFTHVCRQVVQELADAARVCRRPIFRIHSRACTCHSALIYIFTHVCRKLVHQLADAARACRRTILADQLMLLASLRA